MIFAISDPSKQKDQFEDIINVCISIVEPNLRERVQTIIHRPTQVAVEGDGGTEGAPESAQNTDEEFD